jgi:hypothetical protein
MLNVIMLNVIMLNVIMLNALIMNAIILNAIMLSVIMLNGTTLSAVMLNVKTLSVAVPTPGGPPRHRDQQQLTLGVVLPLDPARIFPDPVAVHDGVLLTSLRNRPLLPSLVHQELGSEKEPLCGGFVEH